jgi:hypothetical protein
MAMASTALRGDSVAANGRARRRHGGHARDVEKHGCTALSTSRFPTPQLAREPLVMAELPHMNEWS